MSEEIGYSEAEIQEANKQISQHVAEAYAALGKATAVADKYKLEFSFDVAYGMGGWYRGDPEERPDRSEDGWFASSRSC